MIKRVKFLVLIIAVFGLAVTFSVTAKAQCAMCTTAVESNSQAGKTTTKGLNHGIMYLLAAPYLAIGVVGFIWYKKYRRKDITLEMREQPLHLN